MLSEDGALESDKGGFSIEPFIHNEGTLITWSDVEVTRSLADSTLPIPTAHWRADSSVSLDITAFGTGPPDASTILARYRVFNGGDGPVRLTLYLAIRPFQVNSAWQFLNTTGGFSPIRSLTWSAGRARVNDTVHVVPLARPTAFGATTLDAGDIVDHLRAGRLPTASVARDSLGFASGALAYPLTIPAGGHRDVWIALPSRQATGSPRTVAQASAALETMTRAWRARLDSIPISLPASGRRSSTP
jgi:hypothetical protein